MVTQACVVVLVFCAGASDTVIKSTVPVIMTVLDSCFGDSTTVPEVVQGLQDVSAAAFDWLTSVLLHAGPCLTNDMRTNVDICILRCIRLQQSGGAAVSVKLEQAMFRCLLAAILTPTPSGAASHLVSYSGSLFASGVGRCAADVNARLAVACVAALSHPLSAPLSLPIHAIDDATAAHLRSAKVVAAAVAVPAVVSAHQPDAAVIAPQPSPFSMPAPPSVLAPVVPQAFQFRPPEAFQAGVSAVVNTSPATASYESGIPVFGSSAVAPPISMPTGGLISSFLQSSAGSTSVISDTGSSIVPSTTEDGDDDDFEF
jgi:hypothetical protein